jgi:hypothetical protein
VKPSRELFTQASIVFLETLEKEASGEFDADMEWVGQVAAHLEKKFGVQVPSALLVQEFRVWMQECFEVREIETRRVQLSVVLREIAPDVGYFRGLVAGDCSTSNSAMYVYSPFERNFLIEHEGYVVGHASGTWIKIGNTPVFYFHDLKGTYMGRNLAMLVYSGVVENPKLFGGKYVVVPTRAQANAIGGFFSREDIRKSRRIETTYYSSDIQIRRQIAKMVSSSGYDSPSANKYAHKAKPIEDRGEFGEVVVTPMAASDRAPTAKELTPQALFEFISLRMGGAGTPQYLPKNVIDDIESVARAMSNLASEPLATYYQRVETAFREAKLEFSNRFFENHLAWFVAGHFRARDVYTNSDPVLEKRTVEFLIDMLYRTPATAGHVWTNAARLVAKYPKLMETLKRISRDRSPAGNDRFLRLLNSGLAVDVFAAESELLAYVVEAFPDSPHFTRALYLMLQKPHPLNLSEETWVAVARNLDNRNQVISLAAAKALALATEIPDREDIAEEISKSVKYEEDPSTVLYAAVGYLRFVAESEAVFFEGKVYRRAVKLIQEAGRPRDIAQAVWLELVQRVDTTLLSERAARTHRKLLRESNASDFPACARALNRS